MNEWDKSCTRVPMLGTLMVEHYKAEYPSGTRIMLLSMGEDMHCVEDNTRGTVLTVDDIGTLHCKFWGLSPARIPSASWRKKNWQRNRGWIWTRMKISA